MTDRDLHRRIRRILRGNLERKYPQLGKAEQERALRIAEEAFRGTVSNGEAADIGARAVLREREEGKGN